MMIYDEKRAEKIERIINQALSDALSSNTHRTYREIWVDMFAKIMELQKLGKTKSTPEWREEKPELQDIIGESAGFSFDEFIKSISKIENAICKTLILYGEQQTLN